MSINLENSSVVTGLEQFTFYSSPKEGHYQRMLTYPKISLISHASKVMVKILCLPSAVCELRTSRCTCWVLKRQRNQRSNCQYLLDHRKTRGFQKNISTYALWPMLKPLIVPLTKICEKFFFFFLISLYNTVLVLPCINMNPWKILKEIGITDHLGNLYAGQEANYNWSWSN